MSSSSAGRKLMADLASKAKDGEDMTPIAERLYELKSLIEASTKISRVGSKGTEFSKNRDTIMREEASNMTGRYVRRNALHFR